MERKIANLYKEFKKLARNYERCNFLLLEVEELFMINDIDCYLLLKDIYTRLGQYESHFTFLIAFKNIIYKPNLQTLNNLHSIILTLISKTNSIKLELYNMKKTLIGDNND